MRKRAGRDAPTLHAHTLHAHYAGAASRHGDCSSCSTPKIIGQTWRVGVLCTIWAVLQSRLSRAAVAHHPAPWPGATIPRIARIKSDRDIGIMWSYDPPPYERLGDLCCYARLGRARGGGWPSLLKMSRSAPYSSRAATVASRSSCAAKCLQDAG